MKKMMMFILMSLLAFGALFADESQWLDNFEKAKTLAAEQSKSIMINFTGSDWCPWCMKLRDEVLNQEAFQTFADQKLVLLEADFPRTKDLPEALKTQNQNMAREYNVRGFPTILLVDAEGKVIAQTGYRRGGAEAYVEHIEALLNGAVK